MRGVPLLPTAGSAAGRRARLLGQHSAVQRDQRARGQTELVVDGDDCCFLIRPSRARCRDRTTTPSWQHALSPYGKEKQNPRHTIVETYFAHRPLAGFLCSTTSARPARLYIRGRHGDFLQRRAGQSLLPVLWLGDQRRTGNAFHISQKVHSCANAWSAAISSCPSDWRAIARTLGSRAT